MRRLISILVFVSSVIAAEAHIGNENNTEIRIFSDGMRMVIRTSIPFAWNLLGDGAPVMADEDGQAAARPRLISAAPELFSVSSGGKPLVPLKTDCVFEVEKDVAFVLEFERPQEWPVVVEARFFDRFTSLDTGTIQIFDSTASRFSRDLEPLATKVISSVDPGISFSLADQTEAKPPSVPAPPAVVSTPVAAFGFGGKIAGVVALLFFAVWVGLLAKRRLREEVPDRRDGERPGGGPHP